MSPHRSRNLTATFLAVALLGHALHADARAIRVDDGGGAWTEPSLPSNVATTVSLGFDFNFFGVIIDELTLNPDGSATLGDILIAPFRDAGQALAYSYSTTIQPLTAGIVDGFRVVWGDFESPNQFQLGIFDFGNGNFAMEFNYARIEFGSDATSFIGFDNGDGTAVDLLADLGTLLGDPLTFAEYQGVGIDGLDPDVIGCETPATILACNNYNAVTNLFDPSADILPAGFDDFFRVDPSFFIPVQGRYYFLIENEVTTPVPAPGTLALLVAGLAGMGLLRRRRP